MIFCPHNPLPQRYWRVMAISSPSRTFVLSRYEVIYVQLYAKTSHGITLSDYAFLLFRQRRTSLWLARKLQTEVGLHRYKPVRACYLLTRQGISLP